MRLLHIADVHLDTPFAGRAAELRRRLRQACRDAFREAVDLALDEAVHVVLIAGDLVDGDVVSFQTEGFLADQLRRLDEVGIPVIYATGNHDPGGRSGVVSRIAWPGNVTVVADREPRRISLRDREGHRVGFVTAAGHDAADVTEDLSRRFPPPASELPEVAMLHSQVRSARGSGAHGRYAPSDPAFLRAAGFDYWALGHVHTPQAVSDDPPVHYPGSLQGRSPMETGPRGALLVELGPGPARIDFRALAPIRWEKVTLGQLSEVDSHHRLVTVTASRFDELRASEPAEAGTEWTLVVELVGPSPLWSRLRSQEERRDLEVDLAARLGALAVELRTERLRPLTVLEDHGERQDVLGECVRLLHAVRDGDASLEGLEAGLLGGFDPARDGALESYAASLLEGAEGELVSLFLGGEEEG